MKIYECGSILDSASIDRAILWIAFHFSLEFFKSFLFGAARMAIVEKVSVLKINKPFGIDVCQADPIQTNSKFLF